MMSRIDGSSVIVDLKIEAPSGPHEATASRIAQQMYNLSSFPDNPWTNMNLTILSITYPIPPLQLDRRPLPPGAIAGDISPIYLDDRSRYRGGHVTLDGDHRSPVVHHKKEKNQAKNDSTEVCH